MAARNDQCVLADIQAWSCALLDAAAVPIDCSGTSTFESALPGLEGYSQLEGEQCR